MQRQKGTATHKSVIESFVFSGVLRGNFKRGKRIRNIIEIDLICQQEETTCLIEAKSTFTLYQAFTAFGQVLFYQEVYSTVYDDKTQPMIITGPPRKRSPRRFWSWQDSGSFIIKDYDLDKIKFLKAFFDNYDVKLLIRGMDF